MAGTKRTRTGSVGRAKNPKLDRSKETEVSDADLHLTTLKGKSKQSAEKGKGMKSGVKTTTKSNTRGQKTVARVEEDNFLVEMEAEGQSEEFLSEMEEYARTGKDRSRSLRDKGTKNVNVDQEVSFRLQVNNNESFFPTDGEYIENDTSIEDGECTMVSDPSDNKEDTEVTEDSQAGTSGFNLQVMAPAEETQHV